MYPTVFFFEMRIFLSKDENEYFVKIYKKKMELAKVIITKVSGTTLLSNGVFSLSAILQTKS